MIVYLGILAAMAPLATDMYLPALPELQAEFGSTTSMTQLTLTMTMMGMALGQIFAGPVSDLRGRKIPLLLGMLIFMASSLVCVFINNIYIFLAARLIQGLAGACGIVIARAIARDMCQGAELTTFYAVLMMVNGLAPILAPVIGGQILLLSTWHGIFATLAGIGLVMAVAGNPVPVLLLYADFHHRCGELFPGTERPGAQRRQRIGTAGLFLHVPGGNHDAGSRLLRN